MNSVIWISHDDNGATFVQAPCDDLLKSRSSPRPRRSRRLKSHRKDPPEYTHHLMGVIKHNDAARSQLQKIKSSSYGIFVILTITAYAALFLALEGASGGGAREQPRGFARHSSRLKV